MASQKHEKHYYIAKETLREKYAGRFDQVRSLTKAIEAGSRAKISVELKKNHSIQFVIIGGKNSVEKALNGVKYEFEKGTPPAERLSRAKKSFLDEDDQKKLQHEGKVVCLLTAAALRKHDLLTGATELRQFACPTCNHPWWTHVPRTKPISTCHYCEVCFDALDREKEFGIGRFICLPCDHTFYARCEATEMQDCFKCGKLTGPPYINPRFKPMRLATLKCDSLRPRIHQIINASTPHESTGSTVALSCITEDLGSDIFVPVEMMHSMAEKDYTKPFEDEPGNPPIDIRFDEGSEGSMIGEAGDLELGEALSFQMECGHLEFEEFDVNTSWKRTAASDSSDSSDSSDFDSDDSLEMDKMSAQGSVPDSGISTGSNVGTGSDVGTVSSSRKPPMSTTCEYKVDYPGIAFSKQKAETKVTKEGGEIVGEGIRLVVPPGAVPESDDVTISLQACVGGPFHLPDDDMVFISPVFLIEPAFVFRKSVSLSIDMFVKLKKETSLTNCVFVTSPTKATIKGDSAQWDFKTYGYPNFTLGSRSGKIELNHFCFAGFAKLGLARWSYCVCLYKPRHFCPPLSHAILSVFLQHEVFSENLERYIEKYFGDEIFASPTTRLIRFSKSSISFELPADDVKSQGFTLHSDKVPCEILKEEVDYPIKNKKRAFRDITFYPPHIVLDISREERSTRKLNFELKVSGIKKTFSLGVSLTPSPTTRAASSNQVVAKSSSLEFISGSVSSDSNGAENISGSIHSMLSSESSGYCSQDSHKDKLDDEPKFSILYNHLIPISASWKYLAVNLGLETEIARIEGTGNKMEDRLLDVLTKWRRSSTAEEPYTWRTIITALNQPSLGEHSLAERIRNEVEK